jgi:hypothetical protein
MDLTWTLKTVSRPFRLGKLIYMDVAFDDTSHPPYDTLLREFKIALSRVLSGSTMPGNAIPDGPLTVALLDIAFAVRAGQPTNYLVSRACFEFSKFAATTEAKLPSPGERHLKAVV